MTELLKLKFTTIEGRKNIHAKYVCVEKGAMESALAFLLCWERTRLGCVRGQVLVWTEGWGELE